MKKIGILLVFLLLVTLFAMPASAAERKWPERSITIIAPFKAGGGLDASIRLLAKYWERELGVKLIVENRPGANGQVGTSYFLGLPDDGSNILANAQLFYSSTILLQDAPYTIDDISILNFIEMDPSCIGVPLDSPYNTLADIDAVIKANPGKIRLGAMPGGTGAILTNQMIEHYGWDIKVVHYDGAGESITAMMGGHIDFASVSLMAGMNKVKFLVIWTDKRHPILPDVETVGEALNKKMPFMGASRFVAVHPSLKEKYPERYQFLVDTLEKTYRNPEYQEALKNSGREFATSWLGPDECNRINNELHEIAVQNKEALGGI